MVFSSEKNISTTTYATMNEVLAARANVVMLVLMLMSVVKTELKG